MININRRMMSSVERKFQVFVTQPIPKEAFKILESNDINVIVNKEIPLSRELLLRNVAAGIDGLYCTLNEDINKELLDAAGDKLKVISTCSVGFDHIDIAECFKRSILLGYTPGVRSAIAEYTLALLLNYTRRVQEGIEAARNGKWSTWEIMWMCGHGLKDATVGIFGLGHIGAAIAKRINSFEVERIIYNDVRINEEEDNYKFVNFDTLLKDSDFLICSCTATEETHHIFNKTSLSKMKPNALFVNISRGTVVNQDDLYDALSNNVIRGAVLDVTDPEPLPNDNKLFKLSNCLISPHMCSAEINTRIKMATITSENIVNGLYNRPLVSEIPKPKD